MQLRSLTHLGCAALGLFCLATVDYSQPASAQTAQVASLPETFASSPTAISSSVQILYTGKLLGYFRTPSLQRGDASMGCRGRSPADDSVAATTFLHKRDEYLNAILVGAGDNFSPQLEARVFSPEPSRTDSGIDSQDYAPGNKELYLWYQPTGAKPKGDPGNDRWVFYKPADEIDELQKQIKKGIATIPTDNVGCFLYQARFAAVVPGKHDFYFGAERVRLLARFMASLSSRGEIEPPQMLGANLVIKTTRIDGAVAVPEEEGLLVKWDWPKDEMNSQLKFRDQKLVYPWFSTVRRTVELKRKNLLDNLRPWFLEHQGSVVAAELHQYLEALTFSDEEDKVELSKLRNTIEAFSRDEFSVCQAEDNYKKMALPTSQPTTCRPFPVREIRLEDKTLVESASVLPDALLQNGKHKHYSTVQYGRNYGLCVVRKDKPDSKKGETYCRHFSVYTPFFTYPREVPKSVTGSYTDPDPFVFVNNAEAHNQVAIFGVVDPNLGEQVGVLNFSWLNRDDELKTMVGIEDPAEALRQQLDYFDQKYKAEHSQQEFSGLKILLAQMSPQRARVLAARFPEFQLVVTEADDEQATVEVTQQSTWTARNRKGAFVAVPLKSFDDISNKPRAALGLIEASNDAVAESASDEKHKSDKEQSWVLSASSQTPAIATEPSNSQDAKPVSADSQNDKTFANRTGTALERCAPLKDEKIEKLDRVERIRWLTLCAIRERTGADVALLQKRDFFPGAVPKGEVTAAQLQQTLDRIIWKGDLLTLLFVPGSSIKKAMDQSKKYDADDTSILSLADEKNRGLEYLGVYFDGEQYLINEMPLEDKRIYTVATTDYIGAGDTGYPDFKAAALNPRTLAPQFPQKLDIISAIVCRKLFDSEAKANEHCLPRLKRDPYLDPAIAEAADPKKPNLFARLWAVTPFKLPPKSKITDPIQEQAQRRPIWTLSLHNFSVGFDGLTKNLSDAEIAQKFGGIPTTGITTQQNSSVTAQLDVGLSRTSHENELFLNFGADFKQRSTGDVAPQILQIKNRGTGDIGVFRSLAGGRSQTRVGLALYLHAEAPLQKPFSTFTLSAQERLRITQNRNFLILPRAGLRWLNRGNSFEGGVQAGREFDAFGGYHFSTNGNIVLCTPSSTETFAACVNRLIKAGIVTKDSVASAILENRPRAGFYSRINLTIPITAQAKYVFNEDGDFFFNFHGDNSIDTRFRDISKHSLKFNIWPSFSIGPTLQILLYRNKVNGDFLFQRQFGFETTLSFDLFNRREKMVQIRHKP